MFILDAANLEATRHRTALFEVGVDVVGGGDGYAKAFSAAAVDCTLWDGLCGAFVPLGKPFLVLIVSFVAHFLLYLAFLVIVSPLISPTGVALEPALVRVFVLVDTRAIAAATFRAFYVIS